MNPAGSHNVPEPQYLPKNIGRRVLEGWLSEKEYEDLSLDPGTHIEKLGMVAVIPL